MIQIKTIIPTVKGQYYYDIASKKVFTMKGSQYKEIALDGNSVRLSTELGKRVRYTLDFIESAIPKQMVGGGIRVQMEDLFQQNLWYEYSILSSLSETDHSRVDSHVKTLSKELAHEALKTQTGASDSMCNEILLELLNRPSVEAEEDKLLFMHYSPNKAYVDLDSDEVDGFLDYDLETRIAALFKFWSKNGTSQITFNLKQIAHFLNIEYNNSIKRKSLLEAVKRVSKKNLINVSERFVQSDGYGYIMFTGLLRPRPVMSPYESVLQEVLNQYGDKARSEEFLDALVSQLKTSLLQ